MLTEKQIVLFAELKAEASIMDQLSSSDSSSDSKSSSSSSSSSENSSSDSEDEEMKPSLPMSMPYLQPQPTVSAIPQQAAPDKDASHNRSQESSGHMMNTLQLWERYYTGSALNYRRDGVFLATPVTIIHGTVPLDSIAKLSFAYKEGGDLLKI
ncbi:hypothetical protein llap_22351 [Limosa lapponica baueri]|uniref:Uncharacterized protein n=1 Tax=Limosa lapponica baueri TaxID=1758121 RepID=A0A2I0T0L5_LIMLA|nr:hypothetical protein llap_22351 [Limosa lapponica baueri]